MTVAVLKAVACGAVLSAAAAGVSAAGRPYEFEWANRTADEFAPIDRLERSSGWQIIGQDADASLADAADRPLFGKSAVRLAFRATGAQPSIVLSPKRAIPCPEGFDTVSVWIYGDKVNSTYGLAAEFADANGGMFSVDMGQVRHLEWHDQIGVVLPELRVRTSAGSVFTGFRLSFDTNTVGTLDFTSFSVFRDPKRPLPKTVRAKRGVQVFARQDQGHNTGADRLPFPNRPETMTPPAKDVKGLEFRLPTDNAVDWSELAFRMGGGEWIPLAKNGGLFPKTAAKGSSVRFRRVANSVVAECEAPAGVEEALFGSMVSSVRTDFIQWPYYTMAWCDKYDVPGYEKGGIYLPKTAVLKIGDRTVIVGAMFDWTQSSASAPTNREDAPGQLCCGLMYVPKTDGVRNPVYERFVWTVAEKVQDVFPVIPNPDSPWKAVAGSGVWRAHSASDDRSKDYAYWQAVRDAGMRHIIVTDHEKMWRDGNESFTFRTNAAPKKGGNKAAADYAHFMIDRLGFRYGPYNNFTDFSPINGNWSLDRVGRRWNGTLVTAWNRCYSPKSTWAVGLCEKLAPALKEMYGFNAAYCDVHTCVTPWNRCDYDSRAPGAATFTQVYYDYGEIMLLQKKAWNGPVYSEGDFHWWYAGLTDGNYAQDPSYALAARPWLVDFDLRRMHDKCCNFGMGNPQMFYDGYVKDLASGKPTNAVERLNRFLAATIAFGHPGFLCGGVDPLRLDSEKKSYFLVQGIAAKYTQASVREVRYADERGALYSTETALLNDVWRRSQLKVTYDDGTEVAVNGSMREGFPVEVRGFRQVLPPNGWMAVSGDRRAGSLNLKVDGESYQAAWSDEYSFICRDGKISLATGQGRHETRAAIIERLERRD